MCFLVQRKVQVCHFAAEFRGIKMLEIFSLELSEQNDKNEDKVFFLKHLW